MLVENVKTPVHTAIRWFRKKMELEGIYGQDDNAMMLLCGAIDGLHHRQSGYQYPDGQIHFSDLYLKKMAPVEQALKPYLDLVQTNDSSLPKVRAERNNAQGIKPNMGEGIDIYSLYPRTSMIDANPLATKAVAHHALPLLARAYQGFWKRPICEQVIRILEGDTEKIEYMYLVTRGMGEFMTQLSQKQLAKTNNVLSSHRVSRYFVGCSLERTHQMAQMLTELAKEHGQLAYGVLENHWDFKAEEGATRPLHEVKEELSDIITDTVHKWSQMPAPSKCLPPMSLSTGYSVHELTGMAELMTEGARMHHCVGGYYSAVVAGSSRILSLRLPEAKSSITVELNRSRWGWRAVQQRGAYNGGITVEQEQSVKNAVVAFNVAHKLAWTPSHVRKHVIGKVLSTPKVMSAIEVLMAIPKLRGFGNHFTLKSRAILLIDRLIVGRTAYQRVSTVNNKRLIYVPNATYAEMFQEWGASLRQKFGVFKVALLLGTPVQAVAAGVNDEFDDLDDDIPF